MASSSRSRRARALIVLLAVASLLPGLGLMSVAGAWVPPSPGEKGPSPLVASRVAGVADRIGDLFAGRRAADPSDADVEPHRASGTQVDGPGFVAPVREIESVSTSPGGPDATPVAELPELRTVYSEVVENADGSRTVRSFTSPKYYETDAGVFEPVDNTVVADPEREGWLRNTAGAWDVRFGPLMADGTGGVELHKGETSLTLFPEFVEIPEGGIVPVVGEGDAADTVIYRDVVPGVDLEYVVTGTGVKENLYLNGPVEFSEFAFRVEGASLAAVDGAPEGTLAPEAAADGARPFVVTAPVVTDGKGFARSNVDAKPVSRTEPVERLDGKAESRVVVGVDPVWLAGLGESDFPVVLDPTITDYGGDRYTMTTASGNFLNQFTQVFAGNWYLSGDDYQRSYLQFVDYAAAFGSTVTNAEIDMVDAGWGDTQSSTVWVHEANSGVYSNWGWTTFNSTAEDSETFTTSGTLNVTSLLQDWVSNSLADQAVLFKGQETSGVFTRKSFTATLEVTYTSNVAPPAATQNPQPVDNAVMIAEAPTLSVNTVTDPDAGDTVEYRFQIDDDPTFASVDITGSWGSSPSYTVTSGALSINKDYFWRVQSRDNHGNTTTPTSGFKLRRVAIGYDGFSGYFRGLNTLTGNFIFTETDAHIASVGPALELSRTFNAFDTFVGPFGKGWSSPYFMRWYASGSDIVIQYPDGRRETHKPDGSGGWDPPAGYTAQLEGPLTSGPNTGGYRLWMLSGDVYEFTSSTNGGWLSSITDSFGRELTIDYTNIGSGTVVITDETSQRAITLGVSGAITAFRINTASVPNPAGGSYTWTYTYDNTYGDQRLTSACDARGTSGFCKTYTWDANYGRLTHVYDRKGQLDAELTYGTTGRIIEVTDAQSNTTGFSYSQSSTAPFGIEIEMTDARNNTWLHTYDVNGNLTGEYVPGVTAGWTYTYDATTQMRTSTSDPNGNSSSWAYDANLRPIRATNGEGEKTFTVFDDAGNVVKTCDGRSADANADNVPDADTYCTISDYGGTQAERAKRLIRSRTAPGMAAETWTYTTGEELAYGSGSATVPAGLPRTHTDGRGKVTFWEYTDKGDVARISDSGGPNPLSATRYEAESASSNVSTCTAASGYSGTGYRCNTSPSNGQYVNFSTVSVPSAGLYQVSFRYSAPSGAANRQLYLDYNVEGTAVAFPATSTASDWRTVTMTVPLAAGTNSVKLWFESSDGSSGDLNIDALDVSARSTGGDTRYTYDAIGRALTTAEYSDTFPAGAQTTYTYNAISQVLTTTQPAVTNPISNVTHQLRVTNTYDANGNLTDTDAADLVGGDATRHVDHDFDTMDREWRTIDPEGGVIERRFDAVGNAVHTKDPNGRWIRTTFNARNLPTKTEALGVVANPDTATPVATLSQTIYDDGGRVTATIDTRGERVETTYDDADRVLQLVHIDYRDDLPSGADRDVLLQRYTYNDAGLVTKVEEGGDPAGTPLRTTNSTYDNAGLLTSTDVDGVDRTVTLTRNSAGDVTTSTTTQSGVATGGVSTAETRFTYDSAGRVVCETVENGTTDLYTTRSFDSRGIQTGVIPPRGNTSCSASDTSYRTTTTVDALGRVTTQSAPAVAVESNGQASGGPSAPQRSYEGAAVQTDGAATVTDVSSTAGELLVVVATYGGIYDPNLTISDTQGLTWTEQATDSYDQNTRFAAVSIFTATANGNDTDITVDVTNTVWNYLVSMQVYRYSSHGGVGAVAANAEDANPWGTNYPINQSTPITATDDDSETIAVIGLSELDTATLTPGSGFSEISETVTDHGVYGTGHNYDPGVTLRQQVQVATGSVTSVAWSYGSPGDEYAEAYAAIEILPADSSGTTAPTATAGYNTFGEQTHARDPNGNVITIAYDKLGRRTTVTQPAYTPPGGTAITPTETYVYDAVGNLTSYTSRRGETTSYEYDIFNHMVEQTDPAIGAGSAGVWTFEYGDRVNLTKQVDPTGAETRFTYDARNRPRSKTDVVRAVTVTPQSGAPGPQAAQNVAGGTYTTVFEHDDLGRLVTTTTDEGVVAEVDYNETDDVVSVTDADNKTTTSSVDVYGNPVKITDPLGRQARIAYDSAGRALTAGAYANNAASTPEFATSTGYDADGNTISSTSGEGFTTTFGYDKAGRLTQVVQPIDAFGSATSSYFYDAAGNLTRTRDPRALVAPPLVTEAWDGTTAAAWPAKWTTGQSSGGATDIDANRGRLRTPATASSYSRGLADSSSQHSDAEITATVRTGSSVSGSGLAAKLWLRGSTTWASAGYNLTNGYNLSLNYAAGTVAIRKTVSSTDSSLSSASFGFAANTTYRVRFQAIGTAIKAKIWADGTAEPGSWTLSTTDSSHSSGRAALSQQGTSSGTRDSYVDDYTLRPASTTASSAYDILTTYNTWNLPESVIEPSTTAHPNLADRTFTRVYDAGGLPVEDRQPGSVTVTGTFDELGRLTAESATGGASRSFGYDLAGRTTSVSHPSGTQSFVYDDRGLMIGAAGPAGNMIATFDGDGRLLSRYDPAGSHSFTYTTQNELHTVVDPLTSGTVTYTYNDASQPTQLDYGTGTNHPVRTYTYDNAGRVSIDELKTGTTSKMKATYTYDDDSNILTEIVENVFAATETNTYTYDRAQRLTSFNRQQGAGTPAMTTYRWDHAGNKVAEGATKTWTYDQRNRILAGPEGTYTWDPRGTLDTITNGANTTNYTYDGLGRQTQYATAAVTVDFTYDGLDRIATRTRASTTDAFAYAGAAMDPAKVITGVNATSYSRTPGGSPVAVTNTASSSTAYMGANRHGDNRWNFNTSGTTTDSTVYDPFGNSLASTGSTGDNLGYQSDWTDPDSGNVWMGARWYSPASGTFQSRDTYSGELTTPISLNRYTYAHANPVSNYDPNGNVCFDILGGTYCDNQPLSCASDQVRALDGTCVNPWKPGDRCGANGVRGLDTSICIERRMPGSDCAPGRIYDLDGISCIPIKCEAGKVIALDGSCVSPWKPGDFCGNNGVRNLDLSCGCPSSKPILNIFGWCIEAPKSPPASGGLVDVSPPPAYDPAPPGPTPPPFFPPTYDPAPPGPTPPYYPPPYDPAPPTASTPSPSAEAEAQAVPIPPFVLGVSDLLDKYVANAYRPGAQLPGGPAGALEWEVANKLRFKSPSGHYQKVVDSINQLNKVLKEPNLGSTNRALVEQEVKALERARGVAQAAANEAGVTPMDLLRSFDEYAKGFGGAAGASLVLVIPVPADFLLDALDDFGCDCGRPKEYA
jgi:RHS repeat-associated protein